MKTKSWENNKFFYSNRNKEEKIFNDELKVILTRAVTISFHEVFISKESADKLRLKYDLEDGLQINNAVKQKKTKI